MPRRITESRPDRLWTLRGVVVVLAAFATACGSDAVPPTAPTPPQNQDPVRTSTATPTPAALVGVWNLTVRLTAVTALPGGGSCIAEAMKSQLGVPNPYSLSITDDGLVTIASASGDYACSFRPRMDSSGFSGNQPGAYYYCKGEPQTFRCGNGETYSLASWGQDLSGRVSGSEMTGAWEIVWCVTRDDSLGCVEVETQFTGTK
jgi:hypothetical protein